MTTPNTELALQENRTAALLVPQYSSEQKKLIADTIAKGCTESEMGLFIEIAKASRLNPFTGQIRPVKRWNSDLGRESMVIQTGIDGYRVIAVRTGELAGIDDAIYDSEDDAPPKWAKVTVYRWSMGKGRGEKIPYTATARWSEYVQKKKDGNPNSMWTRMPFLMLGKCAEALALRKAFPDELASIYTDEEMGQAENDIDPNGQQGRPAVQLPQRASQTAQPAQQHVEGKKEAAPKEADTKNPQADQGKAQTSTTTGSAHGGNSAETKAEVKIIEGEIEQVQIANDGSLWFTLTNKTLIRVNEADIDTDMIVGATIKLRGILNKTAKEVKFYQLVGLVELSNPKAHPPDGEILSPENEAPASGLAPDARAIADELFPDTGGKAAVQKLVDNGTLKPASQVNTDKKPGTIGVKRAQRIYTLISQNKKENNGLTEELLKKILTKLPIPIEHLRDLDQGTYETVEKWALGEADWRPFLEED